MKNIVFLAGIISFLTLLNLSSIAQIGFKSGLGFSDIAFLQEGQAPYLGYEINSLTHRKPKLSYQLGVFYTINISKRFDFQPEFLFAMNGLNYSEELIYDDITHKINIAYIKIPVMVRYKIFLKENRQSGLFAGPYNAFKIKATLITVIEGNKQKNETSNVKTFDFGVTAGYFWDMSFSRGDMLIDLRASFSLVNMMDVPEGYIPWYYGPQKEYARNISMMLTVGYRIIGKEMKKNTG